MKKFALIILLAVYGLAIAGAGMAPVMLGGNLACTHADGLAEGNNEAGTSSCGGETCTTCSIGLAVKEHQQAARQFHFASRHLLKLAEGNLPTGLSHVQPTRLYAGYSHIQGITVSAYILHCVYRL